MLVPIIIACILGGAFYTYYIKDHTASHVQKETLLTDLSMSEKALNDKLSKLAGMTVKLDDYEYYYYAEIKNHVFKTEGYQNTVFGDLAFYYVKDKTNEVVCVFPVNMAFDTTSDQEKVEMVVPVSYVVNSNKLVMNAKIKYVNSVNPNEVNHKTDWVIVGIDL